MTSTLFFDGYIITMDKERRLIENGAIYIEDRKIMDIGTTPKLQSKYSDADQLIDASHHVLMPGLINTHNHLFQILLKSMGDDLNLIDWIHACILPHLYNIKPQDLYYAAATGSIELLKSGCTTNADMSYLVHEKLPNIVDEPCQASLDTGIRGYIVRTSENCDQFNLRSPEERITWEEHIESTDNIIKRTREFHKRWNGKGNGRIYATGGPNWPPGSNKELLQEYTKIAKETGLKFVGWS